ncbi:MAG: membrane integrity-associated transporter subunit PqiC [Proteobacteria bacterium]|nr:membrane integrity-associated transporter subunit PqiC [Pseudomonadota bacterium]
MIARRSLGLLAAALPTAFLGACASPNPTLYTLAPVPGQSFPAAPRVVKLRTVGLARYLERPQIVRSSEDYRLDVMSNDWWGEPLGALLARTLIAELTQRLPGSTVYLESGAISVNPDATVEVNIQRMDLDAAGQLVLAAQIAVTGRRPATRSVRFEVTPANSSTSGFAAAASTAVGQLADAIAGMLAG